MLGMDNTYYPMKEQPRVITQPWHSMSYQQTHCYNLSEGMNCTTRKAVQAWFADDSSASGTLKSILVWWKELLKLGPSYGYYPNEKKCVLIVKNEELREQAEELFSGYNLEITTMGKRHLGAIIGSQEYKTEYVEGKVKEWVQDLKQLAAIAEAEPQAAYAAMTFSIQHRWKFVQRTIPNISDLLNPLEQEILDTLIPALVKRKISEEEIYFCTTSEIWWNGDPQTQQNIRF